MSTPTLRLLDRTDSRSRPLFQLIEPYEYRLGPGSTITIPAGYITNFGTIPRWLSWWISPSQLREAAIVHDYMCNEVFAGSQVLTYSGYSRWLADAVLYEAMARLGFGWWKRATVFAAVRGYAIATGNTKWPERPTRLSAADENSS